MGAKVDLMSKRDLAQLAVVGQSLEVLDWILYDKLTFTTGGTQTAFRYFQQAQGNAGLSLEATNMEIPGQLPAGYKFVAQKIVMTPRQGLAIGSVSAKDAFAVTHRGSAQFFIGTRPYLQCPVSNLIGGAFVGFAAATSAAVDVAYVAPRTVINGEMEYSPVIPANFSFSVLLNYDAAPVLTANIDAYVQIVGKLIRPRQG